MISNFNMYLNKLWIKYFLMVLFLIKIYAYYINNHYSYEHEDHRNKKEMR